MSSKRRSRLRSSRGHVQMDADRSWSQWVVGAGTLATLLFVVVFLITQYVVPMFEDNEQTFKNRTWLEFEWTRVPTSQDAAQQLAQRLSDNAITRVYLEAAAWRTDGTLLEGEYAADFAAALRGADPDLEILLWVRMSASEIVDDTRRAVVLAVAERAVREWGFDGVQLNSRGVYDGSEILVQFLRDLRNTIGEERLLSITVPPDRVPSDPDVPVGPSIEADLTWGINYKQRLGLLAVDEMVLMAHASGLEDSAQYRIWVDYQVSSYLEALSDLDRPADLVVALPTYDRAPNHDPAVESIRPAAEGVKSAVSSAGGARELVTGVGLYEYKTTDSLEWSHFREFWLD